MNMSFVKSGKLPFRDDVPLDDQTIPIESVRKFNKKEQGQFIEAFNRYGFAILQCADTSDSRADLCALKKFLGVAAPHPRADADGIVPINSFTEVKGFLGSTSAEHLPHTDGAFLDRPEKIATLQCVTQSTQGGDSILTSALAAYNYIAKIYPDSVHWLSDPQALTISRNNQRSTQAVFHRHAGRFEIKFRMTDGAAEASPRPEAAAVFAALCDFVRSPYNQLTFRLAPGQILVVDNTAVLHGRKPFPENEGRDMRRLNFDGSGTLAHRLTLGFYLGQDG